MCGCVCVSSYENVFRVFPSSRGSYRRFSTINVLYVVEELFSEDTLYLCKMCRLVRLFCLCVFEFELQYVYDINPVPFWVLLNSTKFVILFIFFIFNIFKMPDERNSLKYNIT